MSERYRVEQTGKGFWPYCVRAGNGTRDLYVGHKKTCDRVAAELTTAFRDGEFVGKGLYDALAAEAQALREEVAQQKFLTKVENDALKMMTDKANELKSEVEQLEEELESLRARVVVVPDVTGYWDGLYPAQLRAPHGGPVGFYTIPMVRTDELARLNGKVVSEGLLREARRHLGNWLELHECECEGGFHYCGREQVAKTHRELRSLLDEGKENGHA
ncbi:hypothetical protein FA227_05650 [Pseudomonas aeruginosa]|uniref:hypothetical protein n=1 Tax=Pseudomonas aeruginosa TaxID=287 RepID=UPI00068E20D3|nr:hypothetical protein [Pseudomonas aeruginosa]MCO3128562.1 hypothetical protein [Pseudomonas aeruginosa]MCO3158189.1 hypothetical protein [Pseudomonas aeruginosa]QDL03670.1 hypothetical protein IHMA87_03400 [Pseudomonas aeruginosa]